MPNRLSVDALSIVLVAALAIIWLAYALSPPLHAVHWDTAMYLYKGKLSAESGLIVDLAAGSYEIGSMGRKDQWEAFWEFFRVGHIALIGSTVSLFGATWKAIQATHLLYISLMAGVLLAAYLLLMGLRDLVQMPVSAARFPTGILLSLLLFSLSDVSFYLARSLVSEVPSLLALNVGALLLILSQKRRSPFLAILAGVFVYLAHSMRYEAIWVAIAFASFLYVLQRTAARDGLWGTGYIIAALAALGAFLVHSAVFFPMTDPRFFLEFAGGQGSIPDRRSALQYLASAGGLLWVGFALSLVLAPRHETLRFVGLFLLLSLAPYLPSLLSDTDLQTRMLAPPLFLPVLLGSSIGWSALLALPSGRGRMFLIKTGVAAAAMVLTVVHVPWTYGVLRELPGLWRLQAVKAVDRASFTILPWEKYSYDAVQLSEVAQFLDSAPPLVIFGAAHNGALYLLRFFGDKYTSAEDFATNRNPLQRDQAECRDRGHQEGWERVLTCKVSDKGRFDSVRVEGRGLYQLVDKEGGWLAETGWCTDSGAEPVFETARYAVFACQ